MARNDVDDQTQYGARIKALEANLEAVDAARVALEERVELLELLERGVPKVANADKGVDSMGLPKVV